MCYWCHSPVSQGAKKKAVGPDKMYPFQHLLSREKGFIRQRVQKEWEEEWNTPKKGGNFRRVDMALPLIHTQQTYVSLPRNRAYVLMQLRNRPLMAANT